MTPRVWADFNNRDEQNRVRLNTHGSLEGLSKLPQIEPGTVITVCDDEVEVDVSLERDGSIWVGVMISDYRDATAEND